MSTGRVEIRGLRVGYGDAADVLRVHDLTVEPGEFLSVLGPSGCGKTTLLNTIAGFVQPRAGSIGIDGRDVTALPTYRRGLGLVFQNFALFPHMSVSRNLEYGLRAHRIPRSERSGRVERALDVVGLTEFAGRMPHELSGGQQQRVALARAIVIRPSVLLLDESLSSLDAKLRRGMQRELREIQRELGTTMIFVTHDQDEALTMSDRIALFSGGRMEQLGSPEEVYRAPRTSFVADFVGAANLIRGVVIDANAIGVGGVPLPFPTHLPAGEDVTIALRGEAVRLSHRDGRVRGTLTYKAYSGDHWDLRVEVVGGLELKATASADEPDVVASAIGDGIGVSWRDQDLIVVEES